MSRRTKRIFAVDSFCLACPPHEFEPHTKSICEFAIHYDGEPEIIAEAALTTTFEEIARTMGEKGTLALIDRMREKLLAGEFEPVKTRH